MKRIPPKPLPAQQSRYNQAHLCQKFRVSKTALANLLGLTVPQETVEDIPLNLAGRLEDESYDINLAHALALALERRTELASLRKTQALRKEDIITAKSGYKPLLQGYVGYDVHNSMLSSDLWVKTTAGLPADS